VPGIHRRGAAGGLRRAAALTRRADPLSADGMQPTGVAIVTGAGSGIGRVVARELLDGGFRVALAGRRPDALSETAGGHADALVVPTDVTDASSVETLFETTRRRWGRVDLLFNNAGTFGPSGSVDEITVEDWLATIAVNLTGAFLCARHAVATMKAQRP